MNFTYENDLLFGKPEKIYKAYKRLKDEYSQLSLKNNPIKHSYTLCRNADFVVRSVNVMSAQTENGVLAKVISIDDDSNITHEDLIYTTNDMRIYKYTDLGITPLRCALIASVACDFNYPIDNMTVVGFIGNGNINITTAKVLNMLFGICKFVIRGSKNAKDKNLIHFINALGAGCEINVDYSEDYRQINECDIVISCTSSCDKENLISHDVLWKPSLFIAQDSGYIFDESFRNETICYSDMEEQIEEHYHDEFPFDTKLHELKTMKEDYSNYPKSVYLYGLALADAIVFEETVYAEEKTKFKE